MDESALRRGTRLTRNSSTYDRDTTGLAVSLLWNMDEGMGDTARTLLPKKQLQKNGTALAQSTHEEILGPSTGAMGTKES